MATTDPRRTSSLLRVPPIRDYGTPGWYARLPDRLGIGAVLAVLLVLSAFIRVHYLSGELWSDEANSVGIATHSLTSIPGILRQGGGAPLYFVILRLWISGFGTSEVSLHTLSVLIGVATVPVAMWLGFTLFGRRVGFMFATLVAFNAFLTKYAEEARPYELAALLGLIATGAFVHAFVHRRRGWLPVLGVCLTLLVYTDAWGFVYWAAVALALLVIGRRSDSRDGMLRDALLVFGGAFVVYLPWLPTLIHQATSATAPWHYAPLLGANFPRDLLGTDRVDAVFAIAVLAAFVPLLTGEQRRSAEATTIWAMAALSVGALLLSLLGTLAFASLATRYMAPVVAALLLLVALACARSGILGLVLLVVSCSFLANPASFIPTYKSDMKDVAAETSQYLRPGDLVVVAQPEQAPLADYYLPTGLRYATTLGPDPHPTYMNWDDAQSRLQAASPARTLSRLVAGLTPGQHLLFIRPLTEGIASWEQSWSRLVRRRAAQWGTAIAGDPSLRSLPGVFAPHNYRGSCCISSSALLFVKR